jgi:hypothetical protein
MTARANLDAYFRSRPAPGPLDVNPGERVQYTRYFLRCIGAHPTSDMWNRTGTVVERTDDFAKIRWDDELDVQAVSTTCLCYTGANLRRCD